MVQNWIRRWKSQVEEFMSPRSYVGPGDAECGREGNDQGISYHRASGAEEMIVGVSYHRVCTGAKMY